MPSLPRSAPRRARGVTEPLPTAELTRTTAVESVPLRAAQTESRGAANGRHAKTTSDTLPLPHIVVTNGAGDPASLNGGGELAVVNGAAEPAIAEAPLPKSPVPPAKQARKPPKVARASRRAQTRPAPPREDRPVESGPRSKALFILDMHTFDEMQPGEIPIIPYSHDRNVLLLAHVVARRHFDLFVCCGPDGARERKFRRVTRVYPRWEFASAFEADPAAISFDLIVCAGIEALIMRDLFPEARLVGILPALHMFEAPGLFKPQFVYNFIQSLRNQIDFIITQNERMRETIVFLCHWLARWDPSERVLTARLGLSRDMENVVDVASRSYRERRAETRKRLRVGEEEILVVNAGGAWNWTDCDTFLEAACLHFRQGGRTRVYFSGITQPDNHEINRVRDRIMELLAQYPECFSNEMGDGRPIYIERDWSRGGREIHAFLQAGDLGLSVNKVGFEGWQSHRVRIVDYIGAGLPLLAAGDDLLTAEFCRPDLRGIPGSIERYIEILQALDAGGRTQIESLKAEVIGEHRVALDGDAIYGRAIDTIMRMPRRSAEEIAGLERNFLELIEQQSEARLRDEVQTKLRKMLDL